MNIENFEFKDLTSKIIGSAIIVHNELGSGFQEVIYQRALDIEMRTHNLEFNREFEMSVFYKTEQIGTRRVDFLVEDSVAVELKAVNHLENVHLAQAINYLEAYNLRIGLLLNFGSKSLEIKRLLNRKYSK